VSQLPEWDGSFHLPAEFGRDEPRRPAPSAPEEEHFRTSPRLVEDSVVSKPLRELIDSRGPDEPVTIVVELSERYPGGVAAARQRVAEHLEHLERPGNAVTYGSYLTAILPARLVEELVRLDAPHDEPAEQRHAEPDADRTAGRTADLTTDSTADPGATARAPRGAIHRLWPNFEINALINRSIVTTKCQAAHRTFNATGDGIVWAVLDSGIDGHHPHFVKHRNLEGLPHRSFVEKDDAAALVDQAGHGTHVAGIIAGELEGTEERPVIAATWYRDASGMVRKRALPLPRLSGMAPACKLLSCQVLRPDESGDITGLLAALQYVNDLNAGGRSLQVHGVNISVGHPFDPSWFATGLTPVCREVDLLVRSGVVVVVAAGNTGYGYARDPLNRNFRLGFEMTINDPGNAALALTVGSTSCTPHSTGVSYFSSKGPTGDGRMKPDLVAPGERVVSAAAGKLAQEAEKAAPGSTYIENSGTSMAAPHVSGVAAGFLSVHREFIGNPDRVREALVGSATDVGRSPQFQGAGLVDAMRAIQSL
jgi:subtilisin family serine protease